MTALRALNASGVHSGAHSDVHSDVHSGAHSGGGIRDTRTTNAGGGGGGWIVGAIEAPASVVHSREDVSAALGYLSYLPPAPAGNCTQYAEFSSKFSRRFGGDLPSGGFAVSAYDSVVLVAAALRALPRGGKPSDILKVLLLFTSRRPCGRSMHIIHPHILPHIHPHKWIQICAGYPGFKLWGARPGHSPSLPSRNQPA